MVVEAEVPQSVDISAQAGGSAEAERGKQGHPRKRRVAMGLPAALEDDSNRREVVQKWHVLTYCLHGHLGPSFGGRGPRCGRPQMDSVVAMPTTAGPSWTEEAEERQRCPPAGRCTEEETDPGIPKAPWLRCMCCHGGGQHQNVRPFKDLHRRRVGDRWVFLCNTCDAATVVNGFVISLCRCLCSGCRAMRVDGSASGDTGSAEDAGGSAPPQLHGPTR